MKTCGSCVNWNHTGQGYSGDCRRYPPKLFPIGTDATGAPAYETQYPRTLKGSCCGEWTGTERVDMNTVNAVNAVYEKGDYIVTRVGAEIYRAMWLQGGVLFLTILAAALISHAILKLSL